MTKSWYDKFAPPYLQYNGSVYISFRCWVAYNRLTMISCSFCYLSWENVKYHDYNNTRQWDYRSQTWSQCSVYIRHSGCLEVLTVWAVARKTFKPLRWHVYNGQNEGEKSFRWIKSSWINCLQQLISFCCISHLWYVFQKNVDGEKKWKRRRKKTSHAKKENVCVHVFVCFINRIRVIRYWWGRHSANKGRGGKKEGEK